MLEITKMVPTGISDHIDLPAKLNLAGTSSASNYVGYKNG